SQDARKTVPFYRDLFGWAVREAPMPQGTYYLLEREGHEVAGLYDLMTIQREQGVPAHWLPYVLVASCDEALERAEEFGGKVLMGPHDVMEHGRMGVIQDPTGAVLAVWQAHEPSTAPMGVPGTPCWFELVSRDKVEATAFYSALFGWELETWDAGMDYTLFKSGEMSVGGAMQCLPQMGDVPSHWMTYVAVENTDEAAQRAAELGGQIVHPPTDIPNVGRFAVIADPDGAIFSLMAFASA
ncbi:MAG: VOC family protein, partial [Gemmatimonadetes bacterium]|nr:VOC family protein [Gemmatimonadota bacterium]